MYCYFRLNVIEWSPNQCRAGERVVMLLKLLRGEESVLGEKGERKGSVN